MAYTASNLSVLAYANNFTLWHYTTTDANVTDAGYFNSAVTMLRKGDFIIVNVDRIPCQASPRSDAVLRTALAQ